MGLSSSWEDTATALRQHAFDPRQLHEWVRSSNWESARFAPERLSVRSRPYPRSFSKEKLRWRSMVELVLGMNEARIRFPTPARSARVEDGGSRSAFQAVQRGSESRYPLGDLRTRPTSEAHACHACADGCDPRRPLYDSTTCVAAIAAGCCAATSRRPRPR